MDYQGKTVMVTGGAGFIGSHLCKYLMEHGAHVICIDNFSTGSEKNIAQFIGNDNFDLIRDDVEEFLNPGVLVFFNRRKYLPLGLVLKQVDMIFHLACPASPVKYQTDMVKTISASTTGTYNMLAWAKELKAPIVFTSTSEVYGDPVMEYQDESYWGNVNPMGIRSCYDEGKRCAEALCFSFHRQYGVQAKVARLFNTYGPNMQPDDGRIISNFIIQALKGQPITVYGYGNQTRSYCYVDDTVRGLLALMDRPPYLRHDKLSAINLGNNKECYTVSQVAEKIKKLTGSQSEIVHTDIPEDDPRQRRPVIEHASTYLGWSPTVSFDEGLVKTIEYFKSII